ncbi:hypothetical protein GGQ61_004029 [Phenylobacterium haematophilum]|uniref:Uncharacterized protein n=1 Tax=Phenylobacterium haematophilum TaxID=98513 RepID=A0A840A7W2_9CAUL|nr:hypothetical protein [Phenylobacterium haematophilum]MBB3893287.1 hypothetical protein [Phenylobacterium haematophilum]
MQKVDPPARAKPLAQKPAARPTQAVLQAELGIGRAAEPQARAKISPAPITPGRGERA